MKSLTGKFLLLGVLAGLLTTAAHADSTRLMALYVPFEFMAGAESMPAGTYTIAMTGNFLRMDSLDNLSHFAALPRPVTSPQTAKEASVVFKRYGDTFFLHQITTPGQRVAQQIAKSSLEIELAKAAIPRAEVLLARQ